MRSALVPIALFAVIAAGCASSVGEYPPAEASAASPPSTTAPTAVVEPDPAVPAVAATVEVATSEVATGEAFAVPDVTSRRITPDDLAAMLPPGVWVALPRTNEDLVTLAVLDREDEAEDILVHGRVTGVGAAYEDPAGAHVWIDVLADPDAAHGYLGDVARDIAKGVGGTHAPAVAAESTREFAVDIGDESIGIVADLADGSGTETLIITRAGRVVIFASHLHEPTDDARVATQYLAEQVLDTTIDVLTDASLGTATIAVPRYRFETVITSTDDAGRTVVSVSGIVDGDDRSCTVEIEGPDTRSTLEVIEVGGLRWWTANDGRFDRVGPGNLTAAALLLACPAWPLDADAAGLGPVVTATADPALHEVNGIDAGGYQADADDLAAALGNPITADVDGFPFWVATDAPWLVELVVSMSGDAADRRLLTGPLVDPVGTGTIALRHRVFEIGTVPGSIVPPA